MDRQKLHDMVDSLNEWQVLFLIRYISKMFGPEEDA